MKNEILRLKGKYTDVKLLQNYINRQCNNKDLIISEMFLSHFLPKDGYDYKFDYIDIAENYVGIKYYVDEIDEPRIECVDGVSLEIFLNNFEIKK